LNDHWILRRLSIRIPVGKVNDCGILQDFRSEFQWEEQITVEFSDFRSEFQLEEEISVELSDFWPEFQSEKRMTVEFSDTFNQNSSRKSKWPWNSKRLSIRIQVRKTNDRGILRLSIRIPVRKGNDWNSKRLSIRIPVGKIQLATEYLKNFFSHQFY